MKTLAEDFLISDSSLTDNLFEDSNLVQADNSRVLTDLTDISPFNDWLTEEDSDAEFGDLFALVEPAPGFTLASECERGGGNVKKFRARDSSSSSTSCPNTPNPDGEGLIIPGLIPLTGEFQPEPVCVAPYAWNLCCSVGPLLDPGLGWNTILPWLRRCYLSTFFFSFSVMEDLVFFFSFSLGWQFWAKTWSHTHVRLNMMLVVQTLT